MAAITRNVENFIKLIQNIEEDITNGIDAHWNGDDTGTLFSHEDYPLLPWTCGKTAVDNTHWGFTGAIVQSAYLEFELSKEKGGTPDNWASRFEYFFHLASEHEIVSVLHDETTVPQFVHKVGARHRHWLDVNTIREEMDYDEAPVNTPVASNKNYAAKRIEFLLQLLKMHIMLENNYGDISLWTTGDTKANSADCYDSEAPATSDITNTLNTYYLPGSAEWASPPITGFMAESGYCNFNFTSPYRDGRQTEAWDYSGTEAFENLPLEGWPGTYPHSDMFDEHVYASDWINPNHSDRGMGATAMGPLYEEHGRYTYDDSENPGAAPYLQHDGAVENEHGKYLVEDSGHALVATEPALFWEKWTCRANFEGFLLYAAELIELLDTYYAAKDWGNQISLGNKPVIFGGKAYMSYPKVDSPDSSLELAELKDNNAGYDFMSMSTLNNMAYEISREDLLISDDLRGWWENFLSAYTGTDKEDEAVGTPPASSGGPEEGTSLDIEACDPEEEGIKEGCPDDCVPNPNAFVVDWTLLDAGTTFFNAKTCEYCAVVRLDSTKNNPHDTDLTDDIRVGAENLLKTYLRAEFLKAEWESNIFVQTAIGFDGDTESIATIDMLLGDDRSTLVHDYLGFLPESEDFPKIAENGIYIPDNEISNCRVLVAIPAKLFDKIPVDYTPIREVEPPETGVVVNFLMSEFYNYNPFQPDMIQDVTSAMKYYSYQYADWCSFRASSGEDYGPLNLQDEADKIKQFAKDLRATIKAHGFIAWRLENIEIGFNEALTAIDYIKVNYPGCKPMQLLSEADSLKNQLWNFDGDSWVDHRTLSYVQQLPNMWNDVRAREPMEWNEFIVKYTVDIKSAAAIDEGMPESGWECLADDWQSSGEAILESTLGDIVSLPGLAADKFNKAMCSNEDFKYSDADYGELWKGVKDSALNKALSEFFAGDAVAEMLPTMIEGFKDGGGGLDGTKALWAAVSDKYGWCGILALIDMLMGCLLQGVPTADGLALLCEAAFKSLTPESSSRILRGLSPEKQDEIAAAVGESLGMVFATPPWEAGFKTGSWSDAGPSSGETGTTFERWIDEGADIASNFDYDPDGNVDLSFDFETGEPSSAGIIFVSEQDDPLDSYKKLATWAATQQPEGWSAETIKLLEQWGRLNEWDYVFPAAGAGGIGTIGGALQDVIFDEIGAAYVDAMLGGLSAEEQLAQLNTIPGAEVFSSVLAGLDCAIPDIFDPPLTDFFKGMEVDFCRGNYGLTIPKINKPNIEWLDIWNTMLESLKEMIIQLIVTALLKLMVWLLLMLLNSLCKTMSAFGAALTGDFRAAYRDSFCDSDITDEELDQAAATLFANLNGCDPETLKAAASLFISDLSLVLTAQELVDLFNGTPTSKTLDAVVEMATLAYGDTFGQCDGFSTKSGVKSTMKVMGSIIPEKYKQTPPLMDPARPIHPSLCNDDALAEFESLRRDLFSKRGLTADQCTEQLEQLRNRTAEDIKQLAALKQNGIESLLPELDEISSLDPCAPSLFPTVDPYSAAASSEATKGIMDALMQQHNLDLTANQSNQWTWGSGGLINMIMSSMKGDGYYRHLDKVQDGDDNYFPEKVASHLSETLKSGEFIIDVNTTSADETVASVWGVHQPRDFVDNIDSKYLGYRSDAEQESVYGPDISRKRDDIILKWLDWPDDRDSDDSVDYNINYSSYNIVNDKSVMNDYYRVQTSAWLNFPDAEDQYGNSIYGEYQEIGYEGEQRTEDEIRAMVDAVALSGALNLDINEHLDDKHSPRNSLYAKYVSEVMKSMAPEISTSIDSNYMPDMFGAYKDYCDDIVETYLKKFAERIADDSNGAWIHGFPSSYEEIYELDEDSWWPFKVATGKFVSTGLNSQAGRIYMNSECKNILTGEDTPVPPEGYNSSKEWPAFYVAPPSFEGWGRIMQTFAPDPGACEPRASGAVDFGQLSEFYDELFDTIVEDARMSSDPTCVTEAPWDKILDRSSTCGIETSLRAVLRTYVSEWFIVGMPVFSIFKGDFPSTFDNVVLDFIIENIESGLLGQNDPGWLDVENEYYFLFMEQVVQTFVRMYTRGEIEDITDAELKALESLDKYQVKWEEEVAPVLVKAAYPSLMASGIMTAMGSSLAPFGDSSGGSAILGSLIAQATIKRLKRKYWTSYVAKSDNLVHARVLMRRLVEREVEFIAENVAKDIKPAIGGMHDLFLANSDMMLGSLSEGGPWHVAHSSTMEHDGLSYSTSYDRVTDEDKPTPFMLEKYIKIDDYEYDSDGLPTSAAPRAIFDSLDEAAHAIIRRDNFPHLKGVVNLNDWEDYLEDNSDILGGYTVKQLWKSWKVGLRITQVNLESGMPDNVGWVPDGISEESKKSNKAFDLDIVHQVTTISASGVPTTSDETASVVLIPLVITEKESLTWSPEGDSPAIASTGDESETDLVDTPKIEDLKGSLAAIYDAEFDCLVSDIVKEESYSMIFGYSIPLQRILSLLTIYVMKTFLPSIGSALDWPEEYEFKRMGPDGNVYEIEKRKGVPGGKSTLIRRARFYNWDKGSLFERSKKLARAMYVGYYKATDLDWKPPRPKLSFGIPTISWSLFWWLRKLERHDVFDGDGNPC